MADQEVWYAGPDLTWPSKILGVQHEGVWLTKIGDWNACEGPRVSQAQPDEPTVCEDIWGAFENPHVFSMPYRVHVRKLLPILFIPTARSKLLCTSSPEAMARFLA